MSEDPALRTLVTDLGLHCPVGLDLCIEFWVRLTGYTATPWYGGASGVFRLPVGGRPELQPLDPRASETYNRLLTMYLVGTRPAVFVVYAQAVLSLEGRCPTLLTAEATRLLAAEVQSLSGEELNQRIIRRNFFPR